MSTRYVFAEDGVAAKRSFDKGISWSSIQLAAASVTGKFDLKLFKIVVTAGKTVWHAHTVGLIPEGVQVRWDAVCHAEDVPAHGTVSTSNAEYLHKTPNTLTFPIRYPVIGKTAQTIKITELK